MTRQRKSSQTGEHLSSHALKRLRVVCRKDKKGYEDAVQVTILLEVNADYENFIKGLDELDGEDKFWLLGGFVARYASTLEDPEVFLAFLDKVWSNYKQRS